MHRRLFVAALASWPAARVLAQETGGRPRHKVSAGELHKALSARFPVRFGVDGLLEVEVSAPRLHLLPARNRLGAGLVVQAGGGAVRPPQAGEMDLSFALRYERSDQTVRAHQPEILDLRLPGLPPHAVRGLQEMMPAMARDAIGEVVLHRFSPNELALADTMGFEPEKVAVVEDGLVVWFAQKPRP